MTRKARQRQPAVKSPTQERIARFVASYLCTLNATRAAIQAGYSPKTATSQGSDLLRRPDVQKLLALRAQRVVEKAELTSERVLEELRRIAFIDPALYYDQAGNVLPVHQLPVDARAALHSVELVMKNARAGDGVVDEVLKFKVHDKLKALEILAKYFKLIDTGADINVNLRGTLTVERAAQLTDDEIAEQLAGIVSEAVTIAPAATAAKLRSSIAAVRALPAAGATA